MGEAALMGYVEQMALHLAPRFIRVNCVHRTNVITHLLHNDGLYRMFRPDLENPTREDVIPAFTMFQAMPIPYVEPVDFSNLVLFLASDEAGASPASRSASTRARCSSSLTAPAGKRTPERTSPGGAPGCRNSAFTVVSCGRTRHSATLRVMPALAKRTAGLFAALFVLLSLMSFACGRPAGASERSAVPAKAGRARATARVTSGAEPTRTKTYSLKIGDRTREYKIITPGKPLPKSAPIIVTLSGLYATLGVEVSRDDFVPYASAGEAELVYPVAVHESWNAVGCCSYAGAHNINDLAFLKALVARLDPRHARRIYLVGYSNGARLAYRVACTTPGLFNAYAMVKGVPLDNCVVNKPVSIVQLAAIDDPEVPYAHGGESSYEVPVLTEVKRLRTADKCPAEKAVTHSKQLTYLWWSGCADGTRLALAVWKTGEHSFPSPPVSVPAGAQVIWAFFTKSPIRALPSPAVASMT